VAAVQGSPGLRVEARSAKEISSARTSTPSR
jgi:hypothetical protein